MSTESKKIATISRMNKNLALMQAGSIVTIDIVTPAGQKAKFRTCFVGYVPKKYVLVQYPENNKLGHFGKYIVQGVSVTVRGLIEGHEGSVTAFTSKIKQTIQIPSKLIVLEFPHNIILQSLRNSLRIDTDIDAKIKVDNDYWGSVITDLSVNGCQLMVNSGESLMLAKDKTIEVIVEEFNGAKSLKLQAYICSVKQQLNGVSIGLKFLPISKSSVTQLLQQLVVVEN
jgi:hypothetical protein